MVYILPHKVQSPLHSTYAGGLAPRSTLYMLFLFITGCMRDTITDYSVQEKERSYMGIQENSRKCEIKLETQYRSSEKKIH